MRTSQIGDELGNKARRALFALYAMDCSAAASRREIAIAFDRGALPFGPWPGAISAPELWNADAAWRHGLPGHAVAVGAVDVKTLALPDDWGARLVPFSA